MEKLAAEKMLIDMMDRYKDLVFSICLRLTGDYFAAEDLTQETFLSAYRHLDSFDGKNTKAWLARIAANRAVDHNRALARRDVPSDDDASMDKAAPGGTGPPEVFSAREAVRTVEEACGQLPESMRSDALMYFVDGMSAGEISKRTDVPLKTVQTRIYRAREILRKRIRREDILP